MNLPAREPDRHPATAKPVYVPYALRLMAAWSWRGILVVAGAALLIKGLSAVTIVFVPVLVSLLVAALLSPVVDGLEKRRWRRGLVTRHRGPQEFSLTTQWVRVPPGRDCPFDVVT